VTSYLYYIFIVLELQDKWAKYSITIRWRV